MKSVYADELWLVFVGNREITREKIAENRYQIIFKTTALLEFRNLFRCIEYHHNHTKMYEMISI